MWIHTNLISLPIFSLPAANSHGPLAIINQLKLDISIENAYGKTRTPEFLAMNPCHCAPCLEFDDGTSMWESCAIMRYLVVNFDKENKLYPKDDKLRGRIDMVMDWRQTWYVLLIDLVFRIVCRIHICHSLLPNQTTIYTVSTPNYPTLAT